MLRIVTLGARRGPAPSVAVARPQAIGAQPPPQCGAADPKSARRLGQLATRAFERVENRLALALGQRPLAVAVGEEQHFAQLGGPLLQGPCAPAKRDELLAQAFAVMRAA